VRVPYPLEIHARTIWGEARGEPFRGKLAVAWVIRNRVQRPQRFGEGYEGVCLRPKQFSCWNEGDPNRELIERASLFDPELSRALGIAALVQSGDLDDPTGGADHYHHIAVTPSWAERMQPTAVIGCHCFLREQT
jgi:N-acetylmuramoyl-L-alanine amidase